MVIERDNENIIFKLNGSINVKAAQKVIDYLNLMESIAQNKGTQEQADELARDSHQAWLQENKNRFSR